jgi:hypothetical protein
MVAAVSSYARSAARSQLRRPVAFALVLVAQLAFAAAASACTDSWKTAASGNWNVGANWSTGAVPGSGDDACITLSGTYTVTYGSGNTGVSSLTLGSATATGTQMLSVSSPLGNSATLQFSAASAIDKSGQLAIDSPMGAGTTNLLGSSGATLTNSGSITWQAESTSTNFLETNLDNATGGAIEVKSGELRQDNNTTTTNSGTFTTDSGATPAEAYNLTTGSDHFNNAAGTVANNGAITLTSGASWAQSGGGTTGNPVSQFSGAFSDTGTGTPSAFHLTDSVAVSGTIAAGEIVTAVAPSGHNATLNLGAATVTNNGTIALDSPASGGAAIIFNGTLDNAGAVDTQVEAGGNLDYLEASLSNTGTVEVKSGEFRQDNNTATTNGSTFQIDAGASFTMTTGSDTFANNAGTVVNNGTVTLTSGASWSQHGGSETNNPTTQYGGSFADTGTGSGGKFDLEDSVGVSGTIAPGETLSLLGIPSHGATASLAAGVVNDGTIVLDAQSAGGKPALAGGSLTNNATIDTQVETGGSVDLLETALTNASTGTVEVKSGEFRQDNNTSTTNTGTFQIDAGGSFTMTTGSDAFANDAGTVVDTGAVALNNGASWSENGGSESGNAVTLTGGGLADSGTVGSAGSFHIEDSVLVSGTIAAGETVSMLGIPSHNATANLNTGTVTNNGTIVLDAQASGGVPAVSNGTLDNNGTIETQVETGGSYDALEATLNNASGGTVEVKSGEFRQDNNTGTNNSGTFQTDAGASPGYTLTTGSDRFTNQASGSVANSGAIKLTNGASWAQSGGSTTGNAVALFGGALSDTGAGATGFFDLTDTVGVTGTIAAGEVVTGVGVPSHNSNLNLSAGTVTNDGKIVLDSPTSGGYAAITNGTLDNVGTLDAQVEGTNLNYLEATLVNTGTVEVKSGEFRQDGNTVTTNDATWKTDAGASFTMTTGSDSFVNNGTVANAGAITLTGGASWSQHGGSESGNPTTQYGGSFADTGTGSGGKFDLEDSVSVSGTIAAGETIGVLGIPSHNGTATLAGAGVTNNGTIVLDSQAGGGYGSIASGPLTNNGTIDTQVEGSNLNYLEANLTNTTTGTVEVKSGEFRQDNNTTTTNHGNVILDVAGRLNLTTGSDLFSEQADGTLTFDISGATTFGTLNMTGGATFSLAGGTAVPVLQGGYAPAVGTAFDVITGPHGAGTFATITNDFTGQYSNAGFIALIRDKDTTGVTVGSSVNPSVSGQSVTFTATVNPGPSGVGNPTGTVTFFDNGTSIGTGPVSTTSGVTTATLSTSTLALGTHPITASYGGDANFKASPVSSPALDQAVTASSSATTLASSLNPSNYGQSVKLTATIAPGAGASGNPTGTVTFLDNGTSIGTGPVSTTGGVTTATLTTSTLPVGSHPLTASYGGDSNYSGSTSTPALSQVVNKAATGTTLGSSLNPSAIGQSVTFTATVTGVAGASAPAGTVTFFDNGTSLGAGTLSTTAGVTTATLTTGVLAIGTHPITATYGGDSDYTGSTTASALGQLVNKAATTTTVGSSQNPSVQNQAVTFTATVAATTSGSGNPTGTVTFFDNGSSIGTGPVATAGGVTTATLSTSALAVGSHPITASYGGDGNHSTSTSSPALNQVVNAAAPAATTLTTSLSGGGRAGAQISVPAGTAVADAAALGGTNAARAGGSVQYTVFSDSACAHAVTSAGGGNVTSGSVPSSNAVTLLAGTYYWQAQYSGDAANQASRSACGSEVLTVTSSGSGAPVIDAKASAIAFEKATVTLSTPTADDLLVAFVAGASPQHAGNSAVVTGGGVTWKLVKREDHGHGDAEVWVARASGLLSKAKITAALTRYKHFDVSITVIVFRNASGTGAAAAVSALKGAPTASVTTTGADSQVFAVGEDWKASVLPTPAAGQTIVHEGTDRKDAYWVQTTSAATPAAGTAVKIDDKAPVKEPYILVLVEVR